MKPTDIPNGIVVKGPRGTPVLIDFDDNGNVENKGVEVSIKGWDAFDDGIPDDITVLVHSVKGDDGMLVKNLEVSRIMDDGGKTTVGKVARMGAFGKLAKTLRSRYIERIQMKEIDEELQIIEGPTGPNNIVELGSIQDEECGGVT
jgi:hypothetical protein